MSNQILSQTPTPGNGQPSNADNRIDVTTFLTRRIVAFARLSAGASPSRCVFWQGQIATYHTQLKQAMTNPIFQGVSDEPAA